MFSVRRWATGAWRRARGRDERHKVSTARGKNLVSAGKRSFRVDRRVGGEAGGGLVGRGGPPFARASFGGCRVTTRGAAERVCARGDNDVYLATRNEVTFLLLLGVVCSVQQCESGLQQRGADRATGAVMDSSCRHGARTFVPRGRVATRPAASEAR